MKHIRLYFTVIPRLDRGIYFLLLLWIPAFAGMTIVAQDLSAQEASSIFDEGVETKINPQDINEDVRQWAFDTALSLEKVLKDIKRLNDPEKRTVLVQAIKDSVTQAQEKRALLLMRFTLNRALKLDELYSDDALSINYVLIPAVRSAITLYKDSDLPFLEENKDKTEEDTIELPNYALFIKTSLPYLLTVSTMNPSYKHQFSILKLSVVWVTQDLARSKETNRKFNAHLIVELEKLYKELEQKCEQDITYTDNNSIRKTLLDIRSQIVEEKKSVDQQTLAQLKELISSNNTIETKINAVYSIGQNPSPEATLLLISLLGNKFIRVQVSATANLQERPLTDDHIPLLKKYLESEDTQIRFCAIAVLSAIPSEKSTVLLKKIAREDPNAGIRDKAQRLLDALRRSRD